MIQTVSNPFSVQSHIQSLWNFLGYEFDAQLLELKNYEKMVLTERRLRLNIVIKL